MPRGCAGLPFGEYFGLPGDIGIQQTHEKGKLRHHLRTKGKTRNKDLVKHTFTVLHKVLFILILTLESGLSCDIHKT